MALQTSGSISLNQIHVEAGGTSGTTASLNDSDIRGLTPAAGKTINTSSGTNIDFADFYGASSALSTHSMTVGGNSSQAGYSQSPSTFGSMTNTQNLPWAASSTHIAQIYGYSPNNRLYVILYTQTGVYTAKSAFTSIELGSHATLTSASSTYYTAFYSGLGYFSYWYWSGHSNLTSYLNSTIDVKFK